MALARNAGAISPIKKKAGERKGEFFSEDIRWEGTKEEREQSTYIVAGPLFFPSSLAFLRVLFLAS
jgi:hypothetical protein